MESSLSLIAFFWAQNSILWYFCLLWASEYDIHLSNWQFVKSHENIYVQVSDLIAGLLRKLFLFLDENPLTDIISIAMKLKDAQVKNFTLLWMLIRKSDEKSPLFIKNTNSQKNVQERMLKLQLLGVSNKESL